MAGFSGLSFLSLRLLSWVLVQLEVAYPVSSGLVTVFAFRQQLGYEVNSRTWTSTLWSLRHFGAGILTFLVLLKEIGTFCTQKCSYINFFSAKSAPQSARSAESGSLKHLPKATLELLSALSVKSRTMASELSLTTKLSADNALWT